MRGRGLGVQPVNKQLRQTLPRPYLGLGISGIVIVQCLSDPSLELPTNFPQTKYVDSTCLFSVYTLTSLTAHAEDISERIPWSLMPTGSPAS